MNIVEFKNLTASFQSLMISIAVVTGGMWALITFFKLKMVEKAKADLEKVRDEVTKRSPIKISLSTDQYPTEGNFLISVDLEIENVGTKTELIDWTKSKIEAVKIEEDELGDIELGKPIILKSAYHIINTVSSSIDAGNTENFPFTFIISNHGLYVINAFLVGSPHETEHAREALKNVAEEVRIEAEENGIRHHTGWGSSTFIKVGCIQNA